MRFVPLLFLLLPVLRATDQPCSTAQSCWELLAKGNHDWVSGRLKHTNQTTQRRDAVREHQSPFAVVLSCADSRVPPEVLFDRGVGDLFVIRVAGNVADEMDAGSIQYAVEVQNYAKLVVVLGHARCGAVDAAVHRTPVPDPLAKLINLLRPAVEASKDWPGNPVENAVDAHIHLTVKKLAGMFHSPGVLVVGKRYSLDTGEVTDPQPWKP